MSRSSGKSTQVALGGLAAALSLLLMFLTGMIPFGDYALPAFAGVVLLANVVENGRKTALMVYVAVSLLALFVVPSKEAALLFVFFFGYYPILQTLLDKISVKILRMALKLVIFNTAVIAAYWIIINLMGVADILDEFGPFGQYSALALLVFGNIFFVVYDNMVSNLYAAYIHWFRPRFLRRAG